MKIVKLNTPKDNNLFNGVEPDDHYQNRIHKIVADDYNFNANGDFDVTEDVEVWVAHYRRLQINYNHMYKKVATVLNTKVLGDWANIGNLSLEEKHIAVQYHIAPYTDRVVTASDWQVSNDTDKSNWSNLLENTANGRRDIYELMRRAAGEYIRTGVVSLEQSQNLFTDIHPNASYYSETNHPSFKAWLCSTSVTVDSDIFDYTSTGFASKGYFNQNLLDDLIAIYDGTHYA